MASNNGLHGEAEKTWIETAFYEAGVCLIITLSFRFQYNDSRCSDINNFLDVVFVLIKELCEIYGINFSVEKDTESKSDNNGRDSNCPSLEHLCLELSDFLREYGTYILDKCFTCCCGHYILHCTVFMEFFIRLSNAIISNSLTSLFNCFSIPKAYHLLCIIDVYF